MKKKTVSKIRVKKKPVKKIKRTGVSSSKKITSKKSHKIKLKKIEAIYQDYIERYSKLEEERSNLFKNFVKKLEEKKIEALRKEIL